MTDVETINKLEEEKLDYVLKVRMDKNLRKQLVRYAKRNDNGNVSLSARKAIRQFIKENN